MITLKEVSNQLGWDKSNLSKVLKKLGIVPRYARHPKLRNQKGYFLSEEQIEILKRYRTEGLEDSEIPKEDTKILKFYVIQIFPFFPNRIKFGMTDDIKNRIKNYKTLAPDLKVLKLFPCGKCNDQSIIDLIITKKDKQIGVEVFEIEDISNMLKRLEVIESMTAE